MFFVNTRRCRVAILLAYGTAKLSARVCVCVSERGGGLTGLLALSQEPIRVRPLLVLLECRQACLGEGVGGVPQQPRQQGAKKKHPKRPKRGGAV